MTLDSDAIHRTFGPLPKGFEVIDWLVMVDEAAELGFGCSFAGWIVHRKL